MNIWSSAMQWFQTFFSNLLNQYIMPVWHDIQDKLGDDLGFVLDAGLGAAVNGHKAIFDAVQSAALQKGIELLEHEIGFIANALEHPSASTLAQAT